MDDEITDDSEEFDDVEFVENVTDCPGCKRPCGHQVLKEKKAGTGSNFLLKCDECDHIHTVQIREPRPVTIPFLLSEGADTVQTKIEIDEDEVIRIGDIFEHADASWENRPWCHLPQIPPQLEVERWRHVPPAQRAACTYSDRPCRATHCVRDRGLGWCPVARLQVRAAEVTVEHVMLWRCCKWTYTLPQRRMS